MSRSLCIEISYINIYTYIHTSYYFIFATGVCMAKILTLTYPMVGNYGVPSPTKLDKYGLKQAFESGSIHASALLVQVNARLCGGSGSNSSISGGGSG